MEVGEEGCRQSGVDVLYFVCVVLYYVWGGVSALTYAAKDEWKLEKKGVGEAVLISSVCVCVRCVCAVCVCVRAAKDDWKLAKKGVDKTVLMFCIICVRAARDSGGRRGATAGRMGDGHCPQWAAVLH